MKFSVVPESSARWTAVIARSGSSTAGYFCETMASSFQFVMVPAKIPATVAASRFSVSMPSRLKMTRDRGDVCGQFDDPRSGAGAELVCSQFLVVERAVRAGE